MKNVEIPNNEKLFLFEVRFFNNSVSKNWFNKEMS